MTKVKKFVFNPFSENTYVVWDDNSLEGMIIDAGCSNDDENKTISDFINNQNLNIKYLVSTHSHIDHVLGNKFINEKYSPIFFAPEKDLPLLKSLPQQGIMFGIEIEDYPLPDKYLSELEPLQLGEIIFNLIETPGHTPGEFCIHNEDEKILFSGDVLFFESIGRTDLWGGNSAQLLASIKNKLLVLDKETKVHPGHGESTTIGYELVNNEFLN